MDFKLPYRITVEIFEYVVIKINLEYISDISKINIKECYGRFKNDRFKKRFLLFKCFKIVHNDSKIVTEFLSNNLPISTYYIHFDGTYKLEKKLKKKNFVHYFKKIHSIVNIDIDNFDIISSLNKKQIKNFNFNIDLYSDFSTIELNKFTNIEKLRIRFWRFLILNKNNIAIKAKLTQDLKLRFLRHLSIIPTAMYSSLSVPCFTFKHLKMLRKIYLKSFDLSNIQLENIYNLPYINDVDFDECFLEQFYYHFFESLKIINLNFSFCEFESSLLKNAKIEIEKSNINSINLCQVKHIPKDFLLNILDIKNLEYINLSACDIDKEMCIIVKEIGIKKNINIIGLEL